MDPGVLFDANNVTLLLFCAGLCVVAVVLMTALQFIGGILGFVFGLLGPLLEILAGGPLAWLGCFFMLIACGACGLVSWAIVSGLQSCGTDQAINLCRLFGS